MEGEIQRNALKREKNLAFSENICEEKNSNVKNGPKKSWSGEAFELEIGLVGIN